MSQERPVGSQRDSESPSQTPMTWQPARRQEMSLRWQLTWTMDQKGSGASRTGRDPQIRLLLRNRSWSNQSLTLTNTGMRKRSWRRQYWSIIGEYLVSYVVKRSKPVLTDWCRGLEVLNNYRVGCIQNVAWAIMTEICADPQCHWI